jgi:2-polyprenyl-3-methyl-5-hydroxy-6-metoxy-1,4-benzoquinol methylase
MMQRMRPDWMGFRIERLERGEGWKRLATTPEMTAAELSRCPADDAPLQPLATLIGEDVRIRIGRCLACGHVAYMDRPTEAWFERFYQSAWDSAETNAAEGMLGARVRAANRLGVQRPPITLALGLDLDRTRAVCELGCGHGRSLQQLVLAGFSNVVGVEPSAHRAEATRRSFDFDVLAAPFESPATTAALERRAPFSLIYSIHALEHTFDPAKVLGRAAMLQGEGDYLILSVPNLQDEPTLGLLLFLPHLHSFTPRSLVRLAARQGYALVDESLTTTREINMVFARSTDVRAVDPVAKTVDALDKSIHSLQLDRQPPPRRRIFWDSRSQTDCTAHLPDTGDAGGVITAPDVGAGGTSPRAIVVSALERRLLDPAASPIEIQFAGRPFLLFK